MSASDNGEQAKAKPQSANANLAVRVATAAVGAPAILLILYRAPHWGGFLLIFIATLIGAWELFGMTHHEDPPSRVIGVALTGAVSAVFYWCSGQPKHYIALMIIVPLLGPLVTLLRLGDMKTAALRACAMSMGPMFV